MQCRSTTPQSRAVTTGAEQREIPCSALRALHAARTMTWTACSPRALRGPPRASRTRRAAPPPPSAAWRDPVDADELRRDLPSYIYGQRHLLHVVLARRLHRGPGRRLQLDAAGRGAARVPQRAGPQALCPPPWSPPVRDDGLLGARGRRPRRGRARAPRRACRPLPKIVFSTTLTEVEGNARLATGTLAEELAGLDRDVGVGGAGLAASCFEAGLVDEVHTFVCPVIVGGGTPLLPPVRLDLSLLEARTFGRGVTHARYRVAH